MKFFKLRFKPLNLFYKPSVGPSWKKTHLSSSGKTYTRKAFSFKDVSKIYISKECLPERSHVGYLYSTNQKYKCIETFPDEWEWVEYEVVEKETSPIANGKS